MYVDGDCIYDPGLEAYTHKGGSIENGRQVIVPHLNFSCYGRITHITYVTINGSHPGNKLPVFQIWRPSSFGSNVYNRVGQAQFRSESLIIIEDTVIEDTKFYLTNAEMMVENHQIEFQPGDVIGYYQPSNAHRLIWSIEETNEYVSYSNNASEAFTTFNRSNVDHVDNNLLPFITVGFGKCDFIANSKLSEHAAKWSNLYNIQSFDCMLCIITHFACQSIGSNLVEVYREYVSLCIYVATYVLSYPAAFAYLSKHMHYSYTVNYL